MSEEKTENGGSLIEAEMPVIPQAMTGEVDVQIATAKRWPRNIRKFLQDAEAMATIDEETAESCFYVLVRAGKKIEGPSVRLWEIVSSSWHNLRCGYQIIGETEDRKAVLAEGFCWDLETNVARRRSVRRRITDKHGKRYSDDMITVTSNAAGSIAERNAGFGTIPKAYIDRIYRAAKAMAVGDPKSLGQRRQRVVERLQKFGITPDRILARVNRTVVDELTQDDVETLIGLGTAIKEGGIDIEEAFPFLVEPDAPVTLADKVKAKAEAAKKPEAKTELPRLSPEEIAAATGEREAGEED